MKMISLRVEANEGKVGERKGAPGPRKKSVFVFIKKLDSWEI